MVYNHIGKEGLALQSLTLIANVAKTYGSVETEYFAHGLSFHFDSDRTMNDTIQYCIGDGGVFEALGIVVIAVINRPDQLGTALLRPGRFDRLIYLPLPDEASRKSQ